jgi:hypothetical protein
MVLSSMIGDWITEIVSVIIIIMYEFLLKYCWGAGGRSIASLYLLSNFLCKKSDF